jgi:hypothetical protein
MYNPFPILNEPLLSDRLARGKRYFVRQTYPRGWQPPLKAAFLLRAYDPSEREQATVHMEALRLDPNAFLYDATLPEHRAKLHIAAQQPPGFKIYYAGKIGTNWKPPREYEDKMRNYLRNHHPVWNSKETGISVQAGLCEEYGKLYLKFSFAEEEDRVPLEVIEAKY